MKTRTPDSTEHRGFTLIELILVVSIVAFLGTIAIPQFMKSQLRAKSAEARTNIAAVRVAQETQFAETGDYLEAAQQPAVIPGAIKEPFTLLNSDFARLGWAPEGAVYFSYGIAVSADGTGYTIDAGADIDGDGEVQFWGYLKPDELENVVAPVVGCDTTQLRHRSVEPCGVESGRSIF